MLAGGVLLTASCWGGGAVSRAARILLIVGAAGSVMVGLVPEDVNLSLHVLGAFAGIVVGSCGFLLTGLIRRGSPLGRLRRVTLPLSILAMTAAVLLFTAGIPAGDFGAVERLTVFPCAAGWLSQGSSCFAKPWSEIRIPRFLLTPCVNNA